MFASYGYVFRAYLNVNVAGFGRSVGGTNPDTLQLYEVTVISSLSNTHGEYL